ncbi:hypothetical protein [Streptacidiphilus sp. P02-A3a]|uniref:hypothetical protein n=1 Tax=Streptacidiphilus sp. P02-A3a TaxID=2704468 RepID=UPI0015FCFF37|nr:hypothetical protein [Streptacidiphilus sp. P02-A3a]QMU71771.1 hypothetical protein GXP74_29550 [Streptacidiphilus sp. P02-A3a]
MAVTFTSIGNEHVFNSMQGIQVNLASPRKPNEKDLAALLDFKKRLFRDAAKAVNGYEKSSRRAARATRGAGSERLYALEDRGRLRYNTIERARDAKNKVVTDQLLVLQDLIDRFNDIIVNRHAYIYETYAGVINLQLGWINDMQNLAGVNLISTISTRISSGIYVRIPEITFREKPIEVLSSGRAIVHLDPIGEALRDSFDSALDRLGRRSERRVEHLWKKIETNDKLLAKIAKKYGKLV